MKSVSYVNKKETQRSLIGRTQSYNSPYRQNAIITHMTSDRFN